MSVNLANWIAEHKIDEVECIVPDINGVQRGKVLPAKKFLFFTDRTCADNARARTVSSDVVVFDGKKKLQCISMKFRF